MNWTELMFQIGNRTSSYSLSQTARVHPNVCPLCQWCHPTISSSIVPFSCCPRSLPASGSLQMCQLFASGGQTIGISVSTSIPTMNTQDWSPLGLISQISSQESSPTPQFKSSHFLTFSFVYSPTLTSIHDHWRSHSFD